MHVPKYRLDAIETIGRKILQEYDPALLDGPPQAVPIETMIETKFNLTLEYHCLRKNGSILGETIFDDGAAILYDLAEKRYRLIAVKAGTILIDERLCILTHCAPSSVVQKLNPFYGMDELTDFLETIRQRCKFAYWFFGHYHENQIIDQKYILQWEKISELEV